MADRSDSSVKRKEIEEEFHLSQRLHQQKKFAFLLDGPDLTLGKSRRKVEEDGLVRDKPLGKIASRDHVDDVALRFLHAKPQWLEALEEFEQQSRRVERVSDVHSGYEALQEAFINTFTPFIQDKLRQFSDLVTITPAPISTLVLERFMRQCEAMAKHKIYPRLCFHGTKASHLDSIHANGLLTPTQLYPDGWYTQAIWTATDPMISTYYANIPHMFGCALLDVTGRKVPRQLLFKRINKVEKQSGRCQHRPTHKPSETTPSRSGAIIKRVGQDVITIYDASYVCPLVSIKWKPPPRPLRRSRKVANTVIKLDLPVENVNTICEDHSMQTISDAANLRRAKAHRTQRRVIQGVIRRNRERERCFYQDKRSKFIPDDEI